MSSGFTLFDWLIIALYFLFLIWISWRRNWRTGDTEEEFLLSGRKVTLPAFVATLVSTWYGGILGVGEWSYQFGISQWLILGVPFYIFSAIFAIFLAGKIRLNKALTIPEAVANQYGETAGRMSALPIFILVSPAPYILMLGLIFQFLVGGNAPFLFYASLVALFSVIYITLGGFGAVIRTDILQIILMFTGFIILLFFSIQHFGGFTQLFDSLPSAHLDITGGHSFQYILVWFFIALWTFVDPSFHQRAAAAKSPQTAQKGIFWSIAFWMTFDFLTCFTGMYAFVILGGDLDQPVLAYPVLADQILPVGLKGLFFLSLLATIMSTLDSYLFISGQTLGRDFLLRYFPSVKPNFLTKIGILVSALLGILLIIIYPSVIDLWYVIGSVFIPGLLIPVLGIYLKPFQFPSKIVHASIIGCTMVSLAWLILGMAIHQTENGYAFYGIEPFYPGLLIAVLLWSYGKYRMNT